MSQEESVYDRGGPELSDALIKPDNPILPSELQDRFSQYDIQVIAADAAITPGKSLNIELYLQTKAGKLPAQQQVEDILANLGFSGEEYNLFEARLITEQGDLLCLKLVFQGDEGMQKARDRLPALAQLETQIKKMVKKQALDILSKVRFVAQQSFSLFSSKKPGSGGGDAPSNDTTPKGPGSK